MTDIIGYGGGKSGGGQHVHYEATDSLHSTSYARVLDLVSEGEIVGLAKGLQSIYLDGTPIESANGASNFKDVAVDFRTGTQGQDYIPGFPDVENEVGVGVELRSGTPWVHAISNLTLSAIRITLAVPALSQANTTNGDITGYKIDYQIELSKDGGAYSVVLSNSFNGKTTTQYARSARIDLPPATTGWSIRVTRLTANANTASIADTTNIVSYTDVIDAKLRYPMSAIVGVQVDAKQFQSVPTRSYDLLGRIIQVPTNYDPIARTYSGVWDGTFKPSWTDNPAWVFRDLALNDRYGLGHRLAPAQLDKWSLYAIARYCDEMVPNGKGGYEPRFTCNLYLQSQKQAYAALQDIASVFRGIAYWGGGSIIASADMPMDPVYVYTAANVIGGKYSRAGSGKATRHTVALVSWNDPADFYKAKVEYVEDAEGIKRYGIQQVNLTAFGSTSQGQAQRAGRWALATSRLETGAISFDVGLDGAIALPGQIVRIADPSRMGRRNGGRIKTASGRVVVLDKAPTISAGDQLTIILPSGLSETRTVQSIAGDAVTVTADWTALAVGESVWSVDNGDLVAPTYKILSVVEKDSLTFSITATQHEPGKFAFVDTNTAVVTRPETALDVAAQAAPSSVTVGAFTVSLQDVQKLALTVFCAQVPGATAYEGAYRRDSGNWFILPRQPGPSFDVIDVLPGTYTAKLSAVNSIGITSVETLSAPTVVGKNAPPKNAAVILTASAATFHVSDTGTNPAVIGFTANLIDLVGTVTFSAVGATLSVSGNTATLAYADMPGTLASITVTITSFGQSFSDTYDITKVSDGATSYTWIKYGTSAAGAGLTDNPAGMSYIGLAFNKATATESTNAADYTWSLIKGSNGADGTSVHVGMVYLQSPTQPATPTGGTFNFSTGALTAPTGWFTTQPAVSTTPTWVVQYMFTATTIGAMVTAGTWSTPVAVSRQGADGVSGSQSSVARMYQFAPTTPAKPTGTTSFNWPTSVNSGYSASDGWTVGVPTNPGTPGWRLYVAEMPITAAGGVSTSSVTYSASTVSAWAQNGANGSPGVQTATPTVYQWAAVIPAAPAGTPTYTWATSSFGTAPAGWTLTPGTAVPGMVLWAARVGVTDSAANATTSFTWASAVIAAAGYAGANGQSTVTAYCASTSTTATSAPAATTGKTSLPAVNSGGIVGTYSASVPTLTAGQRLFQTIGIYDPATNLVTWSIPFWSSLMVGNLAAIVVNTGALNVDSTIAMSSTGAIQIGTAAWSGATPTGTGVVMSYKGIASVAGSVAQFSLEAATGAAYFGGTLKAGIVKASSLAVGAFGGALNKDPNFADFPASWIVAGTVSAASGAGGAAPALTYIMAPGGAIGWAFCDEMIPIDSTKTYSLSISAYADPGNNRALYVMVNFYDSTGALITGTGWGDTNFSGYGLIATPSVADWRPFSAAFGAKAGNGHTIPPSAKTCRIAPYMNAGGSSNTLMAVTALKLAEAASGTLIEPGAITTDHLYLSKGGDISSGQTAYDVGTGFWLNGGATPRLSIGVAGGPAMLWNGSNLIIRKATFDSFSVSVSGSLLTAVANGMQGYGNLTATVSGGSSPYQYNWGVTYSSASGIAVGYTVSAGAGTSVASFGGSTTNMQILATITLTVTDSNGRTATVIRTHSPIHGTYSP